MVLFEDDDANYQEFIQAPSHRDGFILNTTRVRSRYAVIHRARCHTIQGVPAAGQRWTGGDYRKVWAESVEELQTWVSQELNAVPRPCGVCHPLAEPEMLLEKAHIPIPVRQINAEVVVDPVAEEVGEECPGFEQEDNDLMADIWTHMDPELIRRSADKLIAEQGQES